MIGIVIFNVLTIALGIAVGGGIVPTTRLTGLLDWLHSIIGITAPTQEQARMYASVWIVATIAMVDGLLFMLVCLTRVVR
jgi:hypothetical protein